MSPTFVLLHLKRCNFKTTRRFISSNQRHKKTYRTVYASIAELNESLLTIVGHPVYVHTCWLLYNYIIKEWLHIVLSYTFLRIA